MDCIGFTRNIEKYLADGLTDSELNDFLHHLAGCEDCLDELETGFIVSEGLKLLDSDRADYDLTSAFARELEEAASRLGRRKLMIRLSFIADTLACWAVICAIFVYIRISFF